MRVQRLVAAGAVALVASLPVSIAAAASPDTSTRVSVGSPPNPLSQNKQNEPGLALDANHPNILIAGSNDEIDMETCNAGNPHLMPVDARCRRERRLRLRRLRSHLEPTDLPGLDCPTRLASSH